MEHALGIATIGVACAALGLAASAGAATDLLSEFAAGKKGAPLAWRVPAPGPTYQVKDGAVVVTIPQAESGFNHWVDGLDSAPMLRADAPAGDWNLAGRIEIDEFGKDSSLHAGIAVGFADGLICAFGPFKAADQAMETPELWIEATGIPVSGKVAGDFRAADLQIEKRANSYEFFYKAGDKWQKAGDFQSAFPPQFVGVLSKTFGGGSGMRCTVRALSVEPVPAQAASPAEIRVDAARLTGKIDPNIYGHFIEHLGRCINEGIWAEMLWNRKFTGAIDERGVIESWAAFGDGATYSRDNRDFYTASQSQRIELGAGKAAGILKQDAHLGIKPGKYAVRAVLKQKGLAGGVTVALRQGGQTYASAEIPKIAGDWTEYRAELDVKDRDPDAQLSVSATGPGTLWVGCLSLMPADNVEGMRRDVLEAIKRIKPPLIRWPGGNMASGYHWEDGLGQRDKRMPRWERAWNTWEWNDFGTDEYIRFCRLVGTEPYICVNAGEGQADEAARWVEYCNGSPETPYGRLRAANGHPEPYRVRYWGIGNEMYGDWQLGHLDATRYALKSIEFARAMKAVDPSIVLIGVGVDRDGFGHWNRKVASIAGSYYDWISVHYYKGPRANDARELTYLNLICASHEIEGMLADTAKIVDEAAGRKLPLSFDEWNIWLPHGIERSMYALRDGLFAAGVFNAMHRLCDHVTMANLAQLVNVLGAIQTSMTEVVETPIYKAFELYANLCQDNRCEISCDCGSFDTPSGRMPLLDASATVSDDGKKLALAVINRDPLRDLSATLAIKGFKAGGKAQISVMNGPDVYATNDFGKPELVQIVRTEGNLDLSRPYVFPAHSVTVIQLRVES